MANPLAGLSIQKNVIWTPKRARGKIVFASVSDLRIIAKTGEAMNFVWPNEGGFLKLIGSQDTFKMNDGNETLPPLVVSEKDARVVLKLIDDAGTSKAQEGAASLVALSRGSFAKLYDAAVSYGRTGTT